MTPWIDPRALEQRGGKTMGSNGHEAAFKMVAEEMLDKLPLGVMQIDRDFTVRFLNAVGARAIGRTAAEVVGKKCYELMQTAHCRTAECRCAQAMQRDAICNGETIARPNGNALPIDYGAAPVHGASGIVGALEFFSDVSVRRRAVDEIVSVSDRLAAGDLTVRAALAFEGDYRVIAENLNRSIEAQHDAVAGVVQSIAELAAASEEIAASSQQLAQGASEQASSLEQTAAALEELASQTKQNAASTRRAQSLAERSFGAAEAGSEAMTRMVTTMGKIRRAAADTSAIIRDINEIAFQTNLLALNAAVEAARAGDAGRGFAVVAEEVRSLALRAKEAARKTEELIAGSLKLSEEGEGVSADVSSKLNEIVHSVREVTGIAADIAQASDSQAQAIEHVNQALAEVDKVVQSTAGSAEQSASAAESLSSQAQRLAQTVNVFQVAHDRGGADLTLEPRNAVASRQARATRPHGRTGAGRGGGGSTGSARAARQLIPLDDEEALGDF